MRATKTPSVILSKAIARRVVALSRDTRLRSFPPLTGKESEEELQLRKAEFHFGAALAKRIWWRLTTAERAQVRSAIVAQDPERNPHEWWMELDWTNAVEHVLTQAQGSKPRRSSRR